MIAPSSSGILSCGNDNNGDDDDNDVDVNVDADNVDDAGDEEGRRTIRTLQLSSSVGFCIFALITLLCKMVNLALRRQTIMRHIRSTIDRSMNHVDLAIELRDRRRRSTNATKLICITF